ncbi:hypothetical protein AB205_0221780 [Aquarana catesbeiana]|uniref:C2H2-type domain-containing protein n=1 Tax=Aquarana catesbeiana TaxID=8400 RepID=A0A2G9Q7R9_AQUCT|nr:hypothetical protein AB205_0221780 [Aquarana catesbeiana]
MFFSERPLRGVYNGESPCSCSKCEQIALVLHQGSHTVREILFRKKTLNTREFTLVSVPIHILSAGNVLIKNMTFLNNRTHTECPYSSSECGKCFSGKIYYFFASQNLQTVSISMSRSAGNVLLKKKKAHQRTHTNDLLYSCPKKKTSRGVFTGECPSSCSECGKCFTEKKILVIQQRNHIGELIFLCSACGKFFYLQRRPQGEFTLGSVLPVQSAENVLLRKLHLQEDLRGGIYRVK